MLDLALVSDPESLDLQRIRGRVQLNAGQYRQGRASLLHVLEKDPTLPNIELFVMWARFLNGEKAEALEWLNLSAERRTRRGVLGPVRPGVRGWIYAIKGQYMEAEAIARTFDDLPQRQAEIYGLLGDKDRAFEALERLAVINPIRAGFELARPEIGLTGDPQVEALRRKMGFPPLRTRWGRYRDAFVERVVKRGRAH